MTTASAPSRPWSPSDRDRMIYKWAKFDGHKQSWIADQLELNQSTVSRIIERYERWIAHGGPIQQGALSRDERLRAQLALTLERNEWIIASSMRLAGEMEHLNDTSKSTTKHFCSEPTREIEVKTENSIRDRTAVAARYLRLAWRIGMDQLKLLEKYDLPALEPLALDPNEYSAALADSRAGFQSTAAPFVQEVQETAEHEVSASRYDGAELDASPSVPAAAETLTRSASEDSLFSTPTQPDVVQADLRHPIPTRSASEDEHLTTANAPDSPPNHDSAAPPMRTTHTTASDASPLTTAPNIISIEIDPQKETSVHAYALPQNPPTPTISPASITHTPLAEPPPQLPALPAPSYLNPT